MDSTLTDTFIVLDELVQDPAVGSYYKPKKILLTLEEDFSVNEDNIDGELCMAAKRMVYYGNLSAELEAQAARDKDRADQCYAKYDIEIRNGGTGEKLTEGKINAMIRLKPDYAALKDKHTASVMYQSKMENFFRSQQRRVDCITALAYKQRAEINKGMM